MVSKRNTEVRRVEVTDAGLSPVTKRKLADDIGQVVGCDVVQVPTDREHPSRGERPRSSILLTTWSTNKLFLRHVGATLVVLAAVVGVAITHSWLMVGLALAVIAGLALWIVSLVFGLIEIGERPHPATLAALEEDGIRDPEQHFSRLVAEFAPPRHACREDRVTIEEMIAGRLVVVGSSRRQPT